MTVQELNQCQYYYGTARFYCTNKASEGVIHIQTSPTHPPVIDLFCSKHIEEIRIYWHSLRGTHNDKTEHYKHPTEPRYKVIYVKIDKTRYFYESCNICGAKVGLASKDQVLKALLPKQYETNKNEKTS